MRVTKYNMVLNENRQNVIIKEKSSNYEIDAINNPYDMAKMMNDIFNLHNMSEEYVHAISLNTKNKVNGVFEIGHGTVNMAIVSPREVLIRMLLSNASFFMIVHNHPSGDVHPSKDDMNITETMRKAGEIVGVKMIDHIIVGEGSSYYSFKEKGWV